MKKIAFLLMGFLLCAIGYAQKLTVDEQTRLEMLTKGSYFAHRLQHKRALHEVYYPC